MSDETTAQFDPISGRWQRPVPAYARPHVPGGQAEPAPAVPKFEFVNSTSFLSLAVAVMSPRNDDAAKIATLIALLTEWVADFAEADDELLSFYLALSDRTPAERALIRRTRAMIETAAL